MLKRSLILNLLLALLLVAGLIFLFFGSLQSITNHGKEVVVPKVTNKNLKEVLKELENMDFEVVIDSTYKSYIDPLEVLQQEPEAGTRVKLGRTIFLLVNRKEAPKVEMPDLVSKSFRNALLILKSYRFVIGDTIYRPDIAAGAVLEQQIKGKKIAAGTMVPFGSRIDLVVGEGLADYEVDVPNLIGQTWREAKEIIKAAGLFEAVLWEGEITDTMNAIVYKQFPEALNELDFPLAIRGGDLIDVHIMQNPSPQVLRQNAPGSLKFQDLDDSLANVIQQRLKKANTRLSNAKKKAPRSDIDITEIEGEDGNFGGTEVIKRKAVKNKGERIYADDKKKNASSKGTEPKAKPKVKETVEQDYSDQYD